MIRRVLLLVLFLLLLVAVWWLARRWLVLDELVSREQSLRDWLAVHRGLGLAIGLGIYVGASLVPGTSGKAIVAGWLYGFWAGLVIVNVGLTMAAAISFLAVRHGLRDLVVRRFPERLARMDAAIAREGPRWLFLARILHVPYWITNHVLGATRLRLRDFWLATQLGLLPGNVVFVLAGAGAPTLSELARQGPGSLLSPGLLAGLVAATLLPLGAPRLVRWAARRWHPPRPPAGHGPRPRPPV